MSEGVALSHPLCLWPHLSAVKEPQTMTKRFGGLGGACRLGGEAASWEPSVPPSARRFLGDGFAEGLGQGRGS